MCGPHGSIHRDCIAVLVDRRGALRAERREILPGLLQFRASVERSEREYEWVFFELLKRGEKLQFFGLLLSQPAFKRRGACQCLVELRLERRNRVRRWHCGDAGFCFCGFVMLGLRWFHGWVGLSWSKDCAGRA